MFGYNTGGATGSGSPVTPFGGFFGGGTAPQSATSYAGPGGQPANLGADTSYPSGVGQGTGATSGSLYSPPNGTLTGLGPDNAFNDPYAGQAGPAQSAGYHPGVLDLNTTGLDAYGGLANLALMRTNPALADALSVQNQNLFNAGNSPVLDQLNNQALGELQSGGQLTPEQLRQTSQGALSNLPAGLLNSPQSMAAQLLNRDQFANSRLQQAQQFASGVQGLNTQQSGLLGNLASQAGGLASSAITNPILQILGLGNLNTNANPSTSIGDQSSLFNPFQQYGNSVADYNANAGANSAVANANASAATNSGIYSLIGSIGGALLGGSGYGASDKRLKTDIEDTGLKTKEGIKVKTFRYKTDNKKTKRLGVIAQDVEKFNPNLVKTDALSGIKLVNYGALGLNPFALQEAA